MKIDYNYKLPELSDLQLKDFCRENNLEISYSSQTFGTIITLCKIIETKFPRK